MPSAKKKSSKPTTCPACAGVDLVRKITTYPVLLTGPLEGKQVHVGRVALHECLTCGHLMPTPAGQVKVDRNVDMGTACSSDNYIDYRGFSTDRTGLPQTHIASTTRTMWSAPSLTVCEKPTASSATRRVGEWRIV
jgi:hypothetical protein